MHFMFTFENNLSSLYNSEQGHYQVKKKKPAAAQQTQAVL